MSTKTLPRRRPRGIRERELSCVGCGLPRAESDMSSFIRPVGHERGLWREVEITHHEVQCPFCALRTVWHEREVKVLGLRHRSQTVCNCRQLSRRRAAGAILGPLLRPAAVLRPSTPTVMMGGH